MPKQLNKTGPTLDVKELKDDGSFVGYASTFGGEPDAYGDVIVAGAYANSISEHKAKGTMPKMFWQHNSNQPIGKWTEVLEDEKGLLVTGRLNLAVQQGAEAHALIKAGDIDGLSIGYRVREYRVDTEAEIWYLEDIDLREVSVVSIGANETATIHEVKSAKQTQLIITKLEAGDRLTEREFENLLKGTFSLSNSQAERAARVHLKGQGEPVTYADNPDPAREFLTSLLN